MNRYLEPDYLNSALITIDVQNDFCLEHGGCAISNTMQIVPNIVRLLEQYRIRRLPIIHVVRLYLENGSNVDLCRRQLIENGKKIVAPGSFGAELVDDIKPHRSLKLDSVLLLSGQIQQAGPNEFIIYKPRWGAFYKTDLESFLREKDVNTLILTGCNYPNCPRTTIYEASERDFKIVLAHDAVSGLYSRGLKEMESIGVKVCNTTEILKMLES